MMWEIIWNELANSALLLDLAGVVGVGTLLWYLLEDEMKED